MAIKVTCDSCFMDFSIKDGLAGKKIKCKECGEVIRVPARSARGDEDEDEFEAAAPSPRAAPRFRPGKTQSGARRGAKKSASLKMPLIIGGLVVGALGLAVVGVLVLHEIDRWKAGPPGPVVVQPGGAPGAAPAGGASDSSSLYPIATLPLPKFPDRRTSRMVPGTQVSVYDLHLAEANAQSRAPGFFMHLRVYLPPGQHAEKSLGCVLVAPAGTNLLIGNELDDLNYHAETLLFAEHEPRLKGCIAYAAASDVETRLAPVMSDRGAQRVLPGLRDFAKRSSPRTHMAHLNCAVFLFHARDDSNEPYATSQKFAGDLQRLGKKVTFESSPRGDHYDSMIQSGIPKAIAWLKSLPGES